MDSGYPSTPGEVLKKEFLDTGLYTEQALTTAGIPVAELLAGTQKMTPQLANELEAATGQKSKAEFWLILQQVYDAFGPQSDLVQQDQVPPTKRA